MTPSGHFMHLTKLFFFPDRSGLSLKGLKHSRLLGSPDHTTMESSHVQTSPQSEASSVS